MTPANTNTDRANRASKALADYREASGAEDDTEALTDLIADLLHLADARGLHMGQAFANALAHHRAERQQAPRYEVQHHTLCQGWINTWSEEDRPQTFANRAEAEAALAEFLAEIAAEIASGERPADECYDPEDFRIVPVTA